MYELTLYDALALLGRRLGLDAAQLLAYADEDTIGGRDTGWQPLALYADEGRLLYALTRALRPTRALEIGVADGCSASHLLSALARNGHGELVSIDILKGAGWGIPQALRERWRPMLGVDALRAELPAAELVFEDGPHTLGWTRAMHQRLRASGARVIIGHDYAMDGGDFAVGQALRDVYGDGVLGIRLAGTITGIGVWINDDCV